MKIYKYRKNCLGKFWIGHTKTTLQNLINNIQFNILAQFRLIYHEPRQLLV